MNNCDLKLFNPEEPAAEWTSENCSYLASHIVGCMSYEELTQFVYEDIYHIMLEDKDTYLANIELYGETNNDEDTCV